MTHDAPAARSAWPPADEIVSVRRTPRSDTMPTAHAAARLYAELEGLATTVTVCDDIVCFGTGHASATTVRDRLGALLGEQRFAGWQLIGVDVAGSGPAGRPDADRRDDGDEAPPGLS